MDRSFLSRTEVIAASRQFVCVRLATYEDAAEALMMGSLIRTKSGEVENSMFCIFAPDGKTKLTRSARGTGQVYSDAKKMAEGMNQIAAKYTDVRPPRTLPLVSSVRLGLDIASADNQPLLVLFGKTSERQKELEAQFAKLAWSKDFIGQFVYVSTTNKAELKNITGVETASEVLIIQPDKFGLKGQVLAQASDGNDMEKLKPILQKGISTFAKSNKTLQNHVRAGHQQGMFWETKIPVTDPEERNARERGANRKK